MPSALRIERRLIAVAALLMMTWLPCCRSNATEPTVINNLVVILTDTLRADRTQTALPAPRTTPLFDRFVERNFVFTHAYSPTSWTRPAVASLFTGLYPQRHGVQTRQDRLDETLPTMAELLAEQGFDTIAVTTNPHVTPTWGLTRGFARVVELMPDPDRLKHGNDAAAVLAAVRRTSETLRPPFFLYVHLIDPHAPYDPPAEALAALGHTLATASAMERYDGEVHFADYHVGEILAALDENALLEQTVVVLTADHGEELYDHGNLGHGTTLYEEVVRIPLGLRVPTTLLRNGAAENRERLVTCPRLRTPVSLVDLAPTLLPLLGVASPPAADGRDLRPALTCAPLPPTPLFFSVDKESSSLAAVRWGEHKLLVDRASGARQLFALRANGGELPSDADAQPEIITKTGALLDAFERSAQPGLHLVLAGAEGVNELRRVEVGLETSGRFTHARGLGFEPADRVELVGGGTRLWASVNLQSVWHRAPKRIWAQDRDEILFDVEPRGASLSLQIKIDGRWAEAGWLRQPGHTGPWPMIFRRTALSAEDRSALRDRRAAGAYLFAREQAAASKVEAISAELEAALAALGYVQ